MKVGDAIGGIYKKINPGGSEVYELVETTIKKITETKRGKTVYPAKHFYSMDADEIESATEVMENAKGFIIQREVVLLTPAIREHFEKWVAWANANPDEVKSLLEE